MSHNKYKEIAIKYVVDDYPSSTIPGSRLSKILDNLENSKTSITVYSLQFLKKQGFIALYQYALDEIDYSEFTKKAKQEQPKRQHEREVKLAKEKAEQEEKRKILAEKAKATMQKAMAQKRAYENDPRTIAKRKQRELKERYGFNFFIEPEDYKQIMTIIRKVDGNGRLSESDIVWLTTQDEEYFTPELKKMYHKREAVYYENKFKKGKNAWSAVNASSHYRKCSLSERSLSLLNQITFSKIRNNHLKSAICTTKGGALRDMDKFEQAIKLATEAHSYDPKSFHPCTLLGAVNYEIGNLAEGNAWFNKAEKRGARRGAVDHELRSIYKRADKKKKDKIRQHLLKIDPHRYSWLRKHSKCGTN
jgi:Flp pilus assembly protein TadD